MEPYPAHHVGCNVRSMFPPRTQVYEGLYPSQIRERFDVDAQEAADHDWYPVNEAWRGPDLHVTYAHDPWRRRSVAVSTVPDHARRRVALRLLRRT